MKRLAPALLALASLPAQAHHFMDGGMPQNWLEGLLSGLGHPVIGPDHAAFVFAAGFLLALSSRGLWGLAFWGSGLLVCALLVPPLGDLGPVSALHLAPGLVCVTLWLGYRELRAPPTS